MKYLRLENAVDLLQVMSYCSNCTVGLEISQFIVVYILNNCDSVWSLKLDKSNREMKPSGLNYNETRIGNTGEMKLPFASVNFGPYEGDYVRLRNLTSGPNVLQHRDISELWKL